MEKQLAFHKFSRISKFGMKIINPYDGAGEGAKLTRLYRFFIASHLSMILVCFAFYIFEDPGAAAITEAVAIILVWGRSIFYMLIMITRHAKWQASLGKIVDERKSANQLDEKRFDLTVKYCNVEVRLAIFGIVMYWVLIAIGLIFSPLLHLNDLRLPFNFYIPGLRFEGLGWKWFINYTFQAINLCSFAVFFSSFVPSSLLPMNQVCLKVDEAALLVEKLRQLLHFSNGIPKSDEPKAVKNVFVVDHNATESGAIKKVVDEAKASTSWANTSSAIKKVVAVDQNAMRDAEIRELTKGIAEKINSVNESRQKTQDLLQLSFLIDFVMLSVVFSLAAFTITEAVAESISVLLGLFVFLSQLFLYCWLGTSLDIRVEKFASSLYDIEWQEMNIQQRKDLLLMLTMIQTIGGFDGVFERVNFETFKEILKFSYSMFSCLKAIN